MTPDIWTVLWPVIVGGVLALLPGAVAQLITHFLNQNAAARAEKRLRFEKLTQALWQYESWVDERRILQAFGTPMVTEKVNPFPEAMTIAIMDFPEIVGHLDEIETRFLSYSQWYIASGLKRLKGDVATMNEGFQEAYAPFRRALVGAHKELRTIAKTLT